MSFVVGYNLMV